MLSIVAILVTERYPKAIFKFSMGVLRWTRWVARDREHGGYYRVPRPRLGSGAPFGRKDKSHAAKHQRYEL